MAPLRLATAAMVSVLGTPAPLRAQARSPVVTAATQVTTNPAPVRAHSSPQIGRHIEPGYQEYPRHPVIAADPSSDRLYALWHGSPESANLPLKFDDMDRADVFLRVSTDSGRT